MGRPCSPGPRVAFIGIGPEAREEVLLAAGAVAVMRDFTDPHRLLACLEQIGSGARFPAHT